MERLSEDVELSARPLRAPVRLGRVTLTGRVRHGRGIGGRRLRTLPEHSLIYVTGGRGSFLDGRTRTRHPVGPGSLLVVCAGLPHWYGPGAGETWDVYFVVVEGPLFDLARTQGLLDPDRPVRTLLPLPYWSGRFADFRRARAPRTSAAVEDEACRVLQLLVEITTAPAEQDPADGGLGWLDASRELLEARLAERLDLPTVAAQVGMPYETWRKTFGRAVGTTPARYRTEHRVAAARDLMRYSTLSLRQIAEVVGFADEHHLSRRFKSSTGISPREFRLRW